MLSLIDQIGYHLPWAEDTIELPTNAQTQRSHIKLNFYYRNALDCVKTLLGEPTLKDHMDFCPRQEFDGQGHRIFTEMSTGNWWWRVQQQLPQGATVIPIILGSDSTKLSILCGNQSAWPVYISIGNIHKDVRYKKSAMSLILLGFLPKHIYIFSYYLKT